MPEFYTTGLHRQPHKCSFCGEMSMNCEALLDGGAICDVCKNEPRFTAEEFAEFAKWIERSEIESLKRSAEEACEEYKR